MKKTILIILAGSLMPLFAQARGAKSVVLPAPKMPMKGVTKSVTPSLAGQAGVLSLSSMSKDGEAQTKEAYNDLAASALHVEPNLLEGMSNAVALAAKENWDAGSKQNLFAFAKGLKDGVNPAEAKKLEEVEKNCRL